MTRTKFIAIGIATVCLGAFVLLFFQPQAALYDNKVMEAAPDAVTTTAPSTPTPSSPVTTPTSSPTALAGNFRPLDHDVTGVAKLITAADGRRFIRLEKFEVDNGPDLFVYMSAGDPAATDDSVYGREYVNLGKLKGNVGDQNYEVPASLDVARFSNVTIWCRRFATGFAVAPLA